MSQYYKLKFISPEPLYAEIQETLRSYFESGAVDDLLFPRWTNTALDKLYNGTYEIKEAVLEIKDYEAQLPDDFKMFRELWMCTNIWKKTDSPNAFYYQKYSTITPDYDICRQEVQPTNNCDSCDNKLNIINKITGEVVFKYELSHLLKPGNINAKINCDSGCPNLTSSSLDTFDINNCKLITNFSEGIVHLTYYSDTLKDGIRFVPDNVRIQEYIKYFIMYKIFEFLSHQITDETSRQIMEKMIFYKQESDKAYIIAETELKKESVWDIRKRIEQTRNRYNNFRIK